MKAVRIHEYGNEDVLVYETAPVPKIQDDEVLIKVLATSVNPVDWKIRQGSLQDTIPHTLPLILGWDVSGVIETVGKNVRRFRAGDEVYTHPALTRNGSYAEYIAVKADEVSLKPSTITHTEAASIPLAGITAWESLVEVGKLTRGQSVLIHGASGGVGSLAVQIAKAKGTYVFGTTSRNEELVKELGADEVINYRTEKFYDLVANINLVFDTVGGETQEKSWDILKFDGRLVSIVTPPSQEKAEAANARGAYVFIQPNAEHLKKLATLINTGEIRPVVGHEFTLREIKEAHQLSQSQHACGKIVINIA